MNSPRVEQQIRLENNHQLASSSGIATSVIGLLVCRAGLAAVLCSGPKRPWTVTMISRAPLLERFELQPSALWWCGCSHKAVSHSLTSLLSFISAQGLLYFRTRWPACFKSIYHHGDGECESCSGPRHSLPSTVDTFPSAPEWSQQTNVCQINHSLQQRNRQPWNWTSSARSKQM